MRPCEYTPEFAAEMCELIAQGENINRLCTKRDDYPSIPTVYRWMDNNPEFYADYMRAREKRAETRVGRIDDIKDGVLSGQIPPDAGRLAVDVEKWQAGKEAPNKYGEKQIIDVNHSGTVTHLTVDLSATLRFLGQTIEGEPQGSIENLSDAVPD